jgi:hypothetical protein
MQEQQSNQFLQKQVVSKQGDTQSEVQQAFTGLNKKRKEIAFEEKQRVDKHNADLNQVKEYCASQMGQRSLEETVIASKTQEAKERCREAKDMSKAQKGVMKNFISEMGGEVEAIEKYK